MADKVDPRKLGKVNFKPYTLLKSIQIAGRKISKQKALVIPCRIVVDNLGETTYQCVFIFLDNRGRLHQTSDVAISANILTPLKQNHPMYATYIQEEYEGYCKVTRMITDLRH
jgi:hypothetical protein